MARNSILYFAYGSNLDFGQMQERCPSARFVCGARLKDHCLEFTRKSIKRNCGVADAVFQRGRDVWGVVYEIDQNEMDALDGAEGYRPDRCGNLNAYNRVSCKVIKDDEDETPINVEVYFSVRQNNPPSPSREYLEVIVQGAKHWGLPSEYIGQLERVKTDT